MMVGVVDLTSPVCSVDYEGVHIAENTVGGIHGTVQLYLGRSLSVTGVCD